MEEKECVWTEVKHIYEMSVKVSFRYLLSIQLWEAGSPFWRVLNESQHQTVSHASGSCTFVKANILQNKSTNRI